MKYQSSNSLKDAFKNIFLNKIMSIATIITLASGVFLFGVTAALTLNVFSITDKLEKDFKLAVYLDENLKSDEINEVAKNIQKIPDVLSVEFVSKEKAFEELKSKYEDPDFLNGIDDGSILRNSYKITLNDLSNSKNVVTSLEQIKGIAKITKLDDEMNKFVTVMNKIQIGTVIISIILALLSVLIITNTINMSIFSRRKQINIMKYVGATDWYIRWPFIFEGILIGLISSAFALIGIYYLYKEFLAMTGIQGQTFGILPMFNAFPIVSALVVSLGVLLGCMGSIASIRKHLKV